MITVLSVGKPNCCVLYCKHTVLYLFWAVWLDFTNIKKNANQAKFNTLDHQCFEQTGVANKPALEKKKILNVNLTEKWDGNRIRLEETWSGDL